MHSGNAAAMPLVRNAATFSFCHASRSVRITTAILVSNCMIVFQCHSGCAKKPSPPLRGLQRLRRADIEKRAVTLGRHFRHCLAVPGDQMAGAAIPAEGHPLLEETARPP